MSLGEILATAGHGPPELGGARGGGFFCFRVAPERVAGRRLFGEWAALDIIVSIIAGSNLIRALTESADPCRQGREPGRGARDRAQRDERRRTLPARPRRGRTRTEPRQAQ